MDRVEQLQKLRAAEPGDADIPYMLAQEYAKRGDHAAALSAFDECIGLDPEYHYAYFHKARVLEQERRVDAARSVLETGLELARASGHQKAVNEIEGYLAELGG